MARLPIVIAPDPVLKKISEPVERVDESIRRLLDDMLETMYAAPGIGLAAPQVSVHKRIIVVDCAGENEPPQPYRLINPEVIWSSDDVATFNEGCLSLPEFYADVTRPAEIKLRYLDQDNEIRELRAGGLLATCIQHEIDHLTGVLFVDYLSALKRNIILRKLTKARRGMAAAAV